jgi:acetyl-CoA carboxylase biotin carboxyl carrier protein
MTIDEIKEIIQLLNESGMAEIEVQRGENRIWLKRTQDVPQAAPAPAPMPVMHMPQTSHIPASAPTAAKAEETLPVVKAPIVGTFYESPSPGSAAFVKPGDAVQTGQVLCIIESMKLMNEIEAEAPGVIVAKLVPNGKPVEYGEALFTYRPL